MKSDTFEVFQLFDSICDLKQAFISYFMTSETIIREKRENLTHQSLVRGN